MIEGNHIASERLGIFKHHSTKVCIVPVYKTGGYHKKILKRYGYDGMTYHQRNKALFSSLRQIPTQADLRLGIRS